MSRTQIDVSDFAADVSSMDRQRVIHEIRHFQGRFPLDFTVEHLNGMTIEQLRHILLAAQLQNQTN